MEPQKSPAPVRPIVDVVPPQPNAAPANIPAAPAPVSDTVATTPDVEEPTDTAAQISQPVPKQTKPPRQSNTAAAAIAIAVIFCLALAVIAYYAYTKSK